MSSIPLIGANTAPPEILAGLRRIDPNVPLECQHEELTMGEWV